MRAPGAFAGSPGGGAIPFCVLRMPCGWGIASGGVSIAACACFCWLAAFTAIASARHSSLAFCHRSRGSSFVARAKTLLDLVGHVDAEPPRRGPAIGIDRLVREVAEVLALVHAAVAERLEEDEREGIDVGGRADLADRVVELLRRAVRGREDPDLSDRLRPRDVERRLVEDLGDSEVEHLHPGALRARREEEIARVEIAMHDALRVRMAEAVRCGFEQLHDLLERAALLPDGAPDRELVRERAPLHPLEDHVRDDEPGLRLPRPGGDAADDVEVALREAVEDAALVAKALGELIDQRR